MVISSLSSLLHVDSILIAAYRVNFNLSLASFEPNVQAARNLVDLALSSPRPHPPRLLFESSVGVLGRELHVTLQSRVLAHADYLSRTPKWREGSGGPRRTVACSLSWLF